jgi:hypothetical protein
VIGWLGHLWSEWAPPVYDSGLTLLELRPSGDEMAEGVR